MTAYALERLSTVGGLTIIGPSDPARRGGLVSFTLDGVHPHDLASLLDRDGIAIRAGHHCAQPLHRRLGLDASSSASLAIYNRPSDIDAPEEGIKRAIRVLTRMRRSHNG